MQTAAVDNTKNDYTKAKIDNVTSKINIGNINEWVYQNCEYVNGKIVVKEKNSAKIIIPIDNEDINGEYLFSFDIDESYDKTFRFKVNDREVTKYYRGYQWIYPLECFSVKVDGNADSIVISLPDAGEYSISDARLHFNSYDKLDRWIERLNKYNLENLNIGDDCIFGTLNNKEKGILALSIPYNDGWRCFVDGKETDILKVNGIFSGIELVPGEHNIEFEFQVPLFREGLLISLSGMAICASVIFYQRQKKKNELLQKIKRDEEIKELKNKRREKQYKKRKK